MNQQNRLLDALETVIAWELPEEDLADALNDQVGLITGIAPEDTWQAHPDSIFS